MKIVEGMETAEKHPKFNAPTISFSNFLGFVVQANKNKGGDSETRSIATKIRELVVSGLVKTELGPVEFKSALTRMSLETAETGVCSEVYHHTYNILRLLNLFLE